MICHLCPRDCGAERTETKRGGVCGMPSVPVAARAMLHQWEEPCLVGEHGAGCVFFSGCALRCCFCQNKPISQGGAGKPLTAETILHYARALRPSPDSDVEAVHMLADNQVEALAFQTMSCRRSSPGRMRETTRAMSRAAIPSRKSRNRTGARWVRAGMDGTSFHSVGPRCQIFFTL